MYLHKDMSSSTKDFQLRCVHYPLQHKSSLKFSDTQKFFKDDCVTETDQMQKGEITTHVLAWTIPNYAPKRIAKQLLIGVKNKTGFLQFKNQTTEELQQFVLSLPKPVAT